MVFCPAILEEYWTEMFYDCETDLVQLESNMSDFRLLKALVYSCLTYWWYPQGINTLNY